MTIMTGNRALRNLAHDLTAKLEDTEFLACYAVAVARSIRRRQRWAKWVVAGAASVPFIAHLRAVSGPTADWLIAIVPLLAIALPIWNPDSTIETATTIHGRYHQVLPSLRSLWRKLRDFEGPSEATAELVREVEREFKALEEELASIRSAISSMPDIRRLKDQCKSSIPNYRLLETEPRRTTERAGPDDDVCYKMGN